MVERRTPVVKRREGEVLNWSECEKAIHQILLEAAEGSELKGDFNAYIAVVESNVASWIDSNFGLEADPGLPPGVKHHHEGPLGSSG
jgi:hypothetical protein